MTKFNTSNIHVVGIGQYIVGTRSVPRLPKQWDLEFAGDVLTELGVASLGSKLVSTKRILPPQLYAVADQGTPDEAATQKLHVRFFLFSSDDS